MRGGGGEGRHKDEERARRRNRKAGNEEGNRVAFFVIAHRRFVNFPNFDVPSKKSTIDYP